MKSIVLALTLATLVGLAPTASAQSKAPDGVTALLGRLEGVLQGRKPEAYLELLSATADRRRAADFAKSVVLNEVTRAAVRERDRAALEGALEGNGYSLMAEVFLETGATARLATWRVDVRRRGDSEEWGIADQSFVSALTGLYRLGLNTQKQYTARDLVITAEDLRLTFEGSVFVAETESGPTAFVLVGRGEMTFSPEPKTERGQIRQVAGAEVLKTPFDAAFLRVSPYSVSGHLDMSKLSERPVDPRDLRRAEELFRQDAGKSYGLDLGDLSNESWSLLPSGDDFLAEIRTARFDILSYAKSSGEVENISLFDRRARRNISLYASKDNLARFGKFFNEDDQSDIVVRDYDIDVTFAPERSWIAGRARLQMEVKGGGVSALTLRLADGLNVDSITSLEFGRLLAVRVRNQNSIVVNLPATLMPGRRLTLLVLYGGTAPAQMIDREAIAVEAQAQQGAPVEGEVPVTESYLYSTRSYWYPQPTISGYATGRIAITVPGSFGCVASGEFQGTEARPPIRGQSARRYVYQVTQPARYFAFLATPLHDGKSETVHLAQVLERFKAARGAGAHYDAVDIRVKTNPRLQPRGKDVSKSAADIFRFYASLIGDVPYPEMTLAVVEKNLPGGHSPAYLGVLAHPVPGSNLSYRDDPASFPDFPEFFLAHEIAHQWWGQAVGWKNYHEQWLSEGFAQYFAALYAEKVRGRGVFESMMRRMRRWAVDKSGEGPIYLGYRVGHVKGDSRLFRALVYNKSAVVLDMLRRIIGDEAFFAGVRRFYTAHRFKKAGSDDLRAAMEAEAGISLERFFDRWIFSEDLPQINFTVKIEQGAAGADGKAGQSHAILRFEQPGEIFDMPMAVVLEYMDRPPVTLSFKLTEKVLETRVPLVGTVRRIDIDRDATTVGIIKEALVTERQD